MPVTIISNHTINTKYHHNAQSLQPQHFHFQNYENAITIHYHQSHHKHYKPIFHYQSPSVKHKLCQTSPISRSIQHEPSNQNVNTTPTIIAFCFFHSTLACFNFFLSLQRSRYTLDHHQFSSVTTTTASASNGFTYHLPYCDSSFIDDHHHHTT